MRLEYIISIWLIILSILIALLNNGYIFKAPDLKKILDLEYKEGRLEIKIYDNDVKIYSITIHPDGKTFNSTDIEINTCPRAVILDTNKGYYKVFDIKC